MEINQDSQDGVEICSVSYRYEEFVPAENIKFQQDTREALDVLLLGEVRFAQPSVRLLSTVFLDTRGSRPSLGWIQVRW